MEVLCFLSGLNKFFKRNKEIIIIEIEENIRYGIILGCTYISTDPVITVKRKNVENPISKNIFKNLFFINESSIISEHV